MEGAGVRRRRPPGHRAAPPPSRRLRAFLAQFNRLLLCFAGLRPFCGCFCVLVSPVACAHCSSARGARLLLLPSARFWRAILAACLVLNAFCCPSVRFFRGDAPLHAVIQALCAPSSAPRALLRFHPPVCSPPCSLTPLLLRAGCLAPLPHAPHRSRAFFPDWRPFSARC